MSAITSGALGNHLLKLRDRKLIEAQGATSGRRYRPWSGGAGGEEPSGDAGFPDATVGADDAPGRSVPPPPTPPPPPALDKKSTQILRSRILDHLSRRRLSEQSLADHLNAEREHVADIVGKLLLDDKIVLDPDGLYRNPV